MQSSKRLEGSCAQHVLIPIFGAVTVPTNTASMMFGTLTVSSGATPDSFAGSDSCGGVLTGESTWADRECFNERTNVQIGPERVRRFRRHLTENINGRVRSFHVPVRYGWPQHPLRGCAERVPDNSITKTRVLDRRVQRLT